MAINISNVYVQTFENNVRQLAQQSNSRARVAVTEKATSSEKHSWDRIGANQASLKTGARQPTPTNNSDWSRRVSVVATYDVGDTSEQEDPIQMLIDPNSAIVRSVGMAMRRQIDDVIFAAATGVATIGDGSTVAFPATQTIGDGTTVFSFDHVTAVYERFMENDIDADVQKYYFIGPKQLRKMQQLVEVTNSDYVNIKALANNGYVHNWMGFTWIVSTRLLAPAAGEISCLAMTKMAMGLQMNRDVTTRVAEDPSISFAWRIYAYMTLGAVRVEDEHIVESHLLNSL